MQISDWNSEIQISNLQSAFCNSPSALLFFVSRSAEDVAHRIVRLVAGVPSTVTAWGHVARRVIMGAACGQGTSDASSSYWRRGPSAHGLHVTAFRRTAQVACVIPQQPAGGVSGDCLKSNAGRRFWSDRFRIFSGEPDQLVHIIHLVSLIVVLRDPPHCAGMNGVALRPARLTRRIRREPENFAPERRDGTCRTRPPWQTHQTHPAAS